MNSYKFNSTSQFILKKAIADNLNIPIEEVYKTVTDIKNNTVQLKDGSVYLIKLEKII